jgi:hypothetical protein
MLRTLALTLSLAALASLPSLETITGWDGAHDAA